MPKFQRVCQNPLHETWSKNNESKVFNVQTHRFLTVASGLQRYGEAELGKKIRHKIYHLCSTCLKKNVLSIEKLLNSLQKMN